MVIHIVRFRSALPDQRIEELFEARAPSTSPFPGCFRATCGSAAASTAASTSGITPRRWSSSSPAN